MATSDQKRKLTRERKILRSESRWLQKALFALGKAESEHAKLLDLRGEKERPIVVKVNGKSHAIDDITSALKETVVERLEEQRTALRENQALARS